MAGMFGGSLIIELIYGIPGAGRLSLDAIFQRDFPILTALVLLGAGMLAIAQAQVVAQPAGQVSAPAAAQARLMHQADPRIMPVTLHFQLPRVHRPAPLLCPVRNECK